MVAHFSSWSTLKEALEYAKTHLAPLERTKGASWRITKDEDGNEKKSVDTQWRFYRQLAIAVGTADAETEEERISSVQRRRDAMLSLTAFNRALREEQRKTSASHNAVVKRVLGI